MNYTYLRVLDDSTRQLTIGVQNRDSGLFLQYSLRPMSGVVLLFDTGAGNGSVTTSSL